MTKPETRTQRVISALVESGEPRDNAQRIATLVLKALAPRPVVRLSGKEEQDRQYAYSRARYLEEHPNAPSQDELKAQRNARYLLALSLREEGKTDKEIGLVLKVSAGRARRLVWSGQSLKDSAVRKAALDADGPPKPFRIYGRKVVPFDDLDWSSVYWLESDPSGTKFFVTTPLEARGPYSDIEKAQDDLRFLRNTETPDVIPYPQSAAIRRS